MDSHVQCVCVCVWKHSQRGGSLTPTSSTCKNQIVMKRTAVTSFPRVPLCPGMLSVAVRLLHGVCGSLTDVSRGGSSLMQNEIMWVHFYSSNKQTRAVSNVSNVQSRERRAMGGPRQSDSGSVHDALLELSVDFTLNSLPLSISTITSSFSENVQKQFFMFTGVTEEDAGTGAAALWASSCDG